MLAKELSQKLFKKLGIRSATQQELDAIKLAFPVCVYCGIPGGKLTHEHLVGTNVFETGSDHPSNIVRAHLKCQHRSINKSGIQERWEKHLANKRPKDAAKVAKTIRAHIKTYRAGLTKQQLHDATNKVRSILGKHRKNQTALIEETLAEA